ncbi:LysR family transcriptional regulator [Pediococcus pentosaceus]|uniref:LysR family transcriptional regulator n=1 Tax=Pediococcus pentosaceus TaxID=1255 RepID=UPI00259B8B24|nr:LysR family transcriptional regulator [Pediococcus pentosaceus]WFC01054.1 LysR family transcriptional regulator [Pediococcus pentosaceus]
MQTKTEKIFSSKTLSYFLRLTDTMSYTQSAQLLGITQPALTQQIKKLEHAVGAPLFYTLSKKLRLTDAGYTMLNATHEINRILNHATDEIQQATSSGRGDISVGILASLETRIFEDFIANYYNNVPEINVTVHMLTRFEIWEGLESNRLDFAITYLPDANIRSWKPYRARKIGTERLVFVHHDERLSKARGVSLKRAAAFDWVSYPEGYYLDDLITEVFKDAMVTKPKSVAYFTTPAQILSFSNSTGIATALPESFVVAHQDEATDAYITKFDPKISYEIGFVYRKDKDKIPRMNAFLSAFFEYMDGEKYIDKVRNLTTKKDD